MYGTYNYGYHLFRAGDNDGLQQQPQFRFFAAAISVRLAVRDRFISRFKRLKAPSRMQIGTLNELIHTTFGWL